MTKNHELYQQILCTVECMECNQICIDTLKSYFETEINSKRSLDSITNLKQLLSILEKRGCLSPNNIGPIEVIAQSTSNQSLSNLVHNYNNNNDMYSQQSFLTKNNVSPSASPRVHTTTTQKVYKLIAEEIGQKWPDFARALNLRESQIDELSDEIRTMSERVYKILDYHENNCDPRRWKSKLLDGLQEARRNDLRKKVQCIFDTQ